MTKQKENKINKLEESPKEDKPVKSRMQQIWDQMNKVYGNDGMCGVGKVRETITTGSYLLDDALIIGGLAKGRIIQYAGREGCGKTFMSMIAIKEWQKLNPDNWAIFIDAEYTYDDIWAKNLGVDVNKVFVIKENSGVEIFTQLCGEPSKELGRPKTKPGILDLEKENPSGLGIIVIDSIASIVSPITMTKAVGNQNIAPLGRFLPDALGRLVPLLSQTNVTCIAINQVRVDVGKMWGDPMSTPGGKALKHHHSGMINFTYSESLKSKLFDEEGNACGHVVNARIDKNKLAPSFRACAFQIKYLEGVVNKHIEIGELAVKYKVVNRPSKVSYEYGDNKWVGKDAYYNGILENNLEKELLTKIKEAKNFIQSEEKC